MQWFQFASLFLGVPAKCQAIAWIADNLLSIEPVGKNYQWNMNLNTVIQENVWENGAHAFPSMC